MASVKRLWDNTHFTYKRQFTQLEKLIEESHVCAGRLHDEEDPTEGKDARVLIEPIEHKLGLIKKYISKLHDLLPEVAEDDDGESSIESLSELLDVCMRRHTDATKDLRGFIESIEQWELLNIKEVKPRGGRAEGGREAPAGGGAARPSEIRGVATMLKPEELTASIQAHEMSVWLEQWAAFRDNSAFGSQGEAAILAYLQQCVSRDILLAVGYRDKRTEKDLLDAIRLYLDSKIHPKILHQLEIWKSRQAEGNTVAETMRRQIMAFYDSNMDANSPQDWLKLLLYATTTDKEILTKILAKTRELETPHQIIEFVDAEESGKKNAGRLLGGKANIARTNFQGGGNKDGTRSPKCFACQDRGHTKSECTVDPSTLWCVHCKTKNHNTYNKCPKNKNKNKGKETPKGSKIRKTQKLHQRKGCMLDH